MTVYVIEGDLSGTIKDALQKRDTLGRAIGLLALQAKEQIWFHDYKDPLAGAPVVLVECSEDFLGRIKGLPGCKNAFPVWTDVETERSLPIQRYFTPLPPKRPSGPNSL